MTLHPPQLIFGARMLYLVWLPADPAAAVALGPEELTAANQAPLIPASQAPNSAAGRDALATRISPPATAPAAGKISSQSRPC